MKFNIKISGLQRLLVLILTLATFLGAASTYAVDEGKTHDTEIAHDDGTKDDSSASSEIRMVTFEAIINFIHIDLHFESYLIQELIQVSEIVHFGDFCQPVYNSGYFDTLFRFIISPNAP